MLDNGEERRNGHKRPWWSYILGERRLDNRSLVRANRFLAVVWGIIRLMIIITLAFAASWHFVIWHELPVWFKKLMSME